MASKRKTNDLYPTYNSLIYVKPILSFVGANDRVLEPCVGYNHIGKHFDQDQLITVDKYRYPGYDANYYMDMTKKESWGIIKPLGIDWVVTNPPFSLAPAILPLAFEHCRKGVIFLLRLSYLEPCKDRSKWLKANSRKHSNLIVINPRINFMDDKNGTDSVTSAWFIWQKNYDGLTQISYYNH